MQLFMKVFLGFILVVSPLSSFAASEILADQEHKFKSSTILGNKPKGMPALTWLKELEGKRNEAEQKKNSAYFQRISKEISATLAGKYGISKRAATAEERELMIASILRTRNNFVGTPDILSNFYFSSNPNKCWRELKSDSGYAQHMGAILAVDAICYIANKQRLDFSKAFAEVHSESADIEKTRNKVKDVAVKLYPDKKQEVSNILSSLSNRTWGTLVGETTQQLRNSSVTERTLGIRIIPQKNLFESKAVPDVIVGQIVGFLDVASLMDMARVAEGLNHSIKKGKFYQLSRSIWTTNFMSIIALADCNRLNGIFEHLWIDDKNYILACIGDYLRKPRISGYLTEHGASSEDEIKAFTGFTAETGRQYLRYLEERARSEEQNIQSRLNWAMYDMTLDFTVKEERQYLEKRANAGDQHAQQLLNDAAHEAKLGFTNKTGRQYLEDRVAVGDQHAQQHLNEAAGHPRLDFTAKTGRQYLEDRVAVGDQHAQQQLNRAARETRLGFTAEIGRLYLEDRVAVGDQHAQQQLNEAACYATRLGFTAEIGRQYLEKRANAGDQHAQQLLNDAAGKARLGFTNKTGRLYLEDRVAVGDQHAQEYLIQDLSRTLDLIRRLKLGVLTEYPFDLTYHPLDSLESTLGNVTLVKLSRLLHTYRA